MRVRVSDGDDAWRARRLLWANPDTFTLFIAIEISFAIHYP